MSVFDLFRGLFRFPGGYYGGDGRRDPFFDGMTHDDDEDGDEDGEDFFFGEDGLLHGDQRDPFDSALRFGFSFGPGGVRIDEPPLFGHVVREMEEIMSQLGQQHGASRLGVPGVPPPPSQNGPRSYSGNSLRDSMLKAEEDAPRRPHPGPAGPPRDELTPSPPPGLPGARFHGWSPFPKFNDIWKQGPQTSPQGHKEDGDLDSAVASGGLDQILAPPASESPSQPWSRSFFKSVTVTKVVKPDGSVVERRTVRDGQGNEETTVMRSEGPGNTELPENRDGPLVPGGRGLFPDLGDDGSIFSRFFGSFR